MKKHIAAYLLVIIGLVLSPQPVGFFQHIGVLILVIGSGIAGHFDGESDERRKWTDGLSRKKRK